MSDGLPFHFRAPYLTGSGFVGMCRFSGDTQPTEVGKDANLLIHEATMADDQVEQARIKAHSTVGQAIEIGRKYVLPFIYVICIPLRWVACLQDERGEDPFNPLFCSLPEDAPPDHRPEPEPDDSHHTSDGTLSVFDPTTTFKPSHLCATRCPRGLHHSAPFTAINGGP